MRGLQYEQLDDSAQGIRLLRILPYGTDHDNAEPPETDTLICELTSHTRGSGCPKYTALSYAWGNGVETQKIKINGILCDVNATIELALREIRRDAAIVDGEDDLVSGKFVWVDQICINQTDDLEKGHQVSHMLQIYSDANHVIAWLGSPWSDCGFLFKYLTVLGTSLIKGDFDTVKGYHKHQHFRNRVQRAYFEFCRKPYWTRLWVIQEYAVPQRLTIACGPWRLDSEHLFAAVIEDQHQLQKGQATKPEEKTNILQDFRLLYANIPSSFVASIMTRRSMFQWALQVNEAPQTDLFVMLTTALVLELDYNLPQTTDPRDRVFSLLGLVTDRKSYGALPDYSRSCQSVYQSVAETMLTQKHVDILAYCQFPKSLPGLPSWAPDWNMELRAPCCAAVFENEFQASSDRQNHQLVVHGKTLVLDGIFVDFIRERSDVVWDPNWLEDFDNVAAIQYVNEVTRFCKSSSRIRMEEEETDIGRIVIADHRGQHAHLTWDEYYPMIRSGLGALIEEGYNNSSSSTEEESTESKSANSATRNPGKRGRGKLQTGGDYQSSDAVDEMEGVNINNEGEDSLGSERTMLARDASWFRSRMRALHSRRPFITSTGFVGLCPEDSKVGDKVFVLLGAKSPYVLRPTGDGSTYTVIGDAYVHGIMYGEMMKGNPDIASITIL